MNQSPLHLDLVRLLNNYKCGGYLLSIWGDQYPAEYKHLKVGGLFVASIALYHADLTTNFKNSPENLDYHHSVFPKEWWEEKLSKYLTKHIYPFNSCNRDYIQPILGCFDERNYIYCGIKL
jgi:hypothetical protein